MAVEYVLSDGVDQARELVLPQTNIKLPGKGLGPNKFLYEEWYLRVESLDEIALYFFSEGWSEYVWQLTYENINLLNTGLTTYISGDLTSSYRWRLSTKEEIAIINNSQYKKTNIPRPSSSSSSR